MPAAVFLFTTLSGLLIAHAGEQSAATRLSSDELLRLGERMYREGILPSGEPMQAIVAGDVPVDGTAFTCISCHLRSGLGSFEGSIYTPPATGRKLFMSYNTIAEPVTPDDLLMVPRWIRPLIRRVPYTVKTLDNALRSGVDPTGRELKNVMPRYLLSDDDLAVLIHYLKNLSAELSPGVTDTTIHVATVITEEVGLAERRVMMDALKAVVQAYNTRPDVVKRYTEYAKKRRTGKGPGPVEGEKDRTPRNLSLDVWELKGAPGTWQAQLEQYYRNKPVLAMLGGISTNDWRPIHDFCERNQIPSFLPITDYPVISSNDWYTLYLSKGLFQEGEAAARYLAGSGDVAADATGVQIIRDNLAGLTLADAFQNTWERIGRRPPAIVRLAEGEQMGAPFWKELMKRHRPGVILVWTGPDDVSQLGNLADAVDVRPMVVVSYGLIKDKIYDLPEKVRSFTYITYPYDLKAEKRFASLNFLWLKGRWPPPDKHEVTAKIAIMNYVLTDLFMRFDRYYYRDYLMDLTGMMPDKDKTISLYPRISFGQNQRYCAKGCYIVQVSAGPKPVLVRKSDWVIK